MRTKVLTVWILNNQLNGGDMKVSFELCAQPEH